MQFPILKPINIDGQDYRPGDHFESDSRESVQHLIDSRNLGDADESLPNDLPILTSQKPKAPKSSEE